MTHGDTSRPDDAERSRTITWTDPAAVLHRAVQMSGLDALRAIRDGLLPPPPMAVIINAGIVEVEPGRVVFSCRPGEEHYNPLGTVHGGLACTLLDTVLGCATQTLLDAGQGYTSIEIKVNYLRPILLSTGEITATATVTKAGRRIVFADAAITDARGNTLATASSSLFVISRASSS